jgi:hypothetical protein
MNAALKKRPWLQIHLSTAIVLMFVVGVLMWANMRGRSPFGGPPGVFKHMMRGGSLGDMDIRCYQSVHGWPFRALK